MSEIKTMHEGGDSKRHPTSGATHKMQKPGAAAGGHKLGMMSWEGGSHHSEHRGKYKK